MRLPAPFHLPAEDDTTGRCLLRDGSVAMVRQANPEDLPLMEAFFQHLSGESLHQRFFRAGVPRRDVLRPLCDSTDPGSALTLVATRTVNEHAQFIGAATYIQTGPGVGEVAFAVGDAFHGKGIATVLLERLLVAGARNGFRRFQATTLPDNLAMQDVFRQSGFQLTATATDGLIDIELAVEPSEAGVAAAETRERVSAVVSIRPFFEPRGIAVVGASRNPASIGRRVLDALLAAHCRVPVYPVHRSSAEIAGLGAYSAVSAIPPPVDLVVIAVPRESVLQVVDDCAAAGVKALVVITAGYAEIDDAGRTMQRELLDKVPGYGMRLVGPNCMGLVTTDPAFSVNASFSPVFPPAGGLALLSQSGALGIILLTLAAERHVGMSGFVSVGNKADVSGNDLLQGTWESDPHTNVIGLYLESFGNPRRFARIARRVSRRTPIVVVKAGRTAAGLRAASSHTAALASREIAVEALLRQSGTIRTNTIDELFDVAACLSTQPLPPGRRVAIVTNAGGPGILASDACEMAGLDVTTLPLDLRDELRRRLPQVPTPGNPVDLIASAGPEAYEAVVSALLASDAVDAVLVLYTPVDLVSAPLIHTAIARGVSIARAGGANHKPVMACLMAESGFCLQTDSEQIPVYAFPENAARALARAADYADWRRTPPARVWSFDDLDPDRARDVCRRAIADRGAGWLNATETTDVLAAFGIRIISSAHATATTDAVAAARTMGFPVVAKLIAPGLVHKTEVGGVRAGLSDEAAVERAWRDLVDTAAAHGLDFGGIMIQPLARGVAETMIGVVRDDTFGPLIGFGLGGTEVELLGDMQFGLAPLTDRDVADLIARSRAHALIGGYRGRAAGDREALVELLLRVSALADSVPELAELDLNPVMIMPMGQGVRLVDVRLKVVSPRG